MQVAGDRLMASLARRHASLFERLGEYSNKAVLVHPIDLPLVIRLRLDPARPRLDVLRSGDAATWDARIAGPLAALLGLVHSAYDGDALFFSRDLVIEGDTEAVLALRNAIDNAELDLSLEVAALLGPLAGLARRPLRDASALVGRFAGVALTRPPLAQRAP